MGVLGAVSCANVEPPPDESIVDPAYSTLKFPTLSELEQKVSDFSLGQSSTEELLQQASYGTEFHGGVNLFLGNYVLGASGWLRHNFENREKTEPWQIEKLRSTAYAIRGGGEGNSGWTLRRCDASEKLYDIMKKAEEEGHVDEAAQVIGYVEYAAVETQSIFSSFGFFFGNKPQERNPAEVFGWYRNDKFEIEHAQARAEAGFSSLSKEVQSELVGWLGRYGYDSLRSYMRNVDAAATGNVSSEIPASPTLRKDAFYKRFGEDLLRGYGLMART